MRKHNLLVRDTFVTSVTEVFSSTYFRLSLVTITQAGLALLNTFPPRGVMGEMRGSDRTGIERTGRQAGLGLAPDIIMPKCGEKGILMRILDLSCVRLGHWWARNARCKL